METWTTTLKIEATELDWAKPGSPQLGIMASYPGWPLVACISIEDASVLTPCGWGNTVLPNRARLID